jgi:hypothetical protein
LRDATGFDLSSSRGNRPHDQAARFIEQSPIAMARRVTGRCTLERPHRRRRNGEVHLAERAVAGLTGARQRKWVILAADDMHVL